MNRLKYIFSLVIVMLFAFTVIAQTLEEKKITTNAEIQTNIIKSIKTPQSKLLNKKMATVKPSELLKNITQKAKNEEKIKPNSKAIKSQ